MKPDPRPPSDDAWRTLATLSSDMLALLDADGTVVWVNPAFERISGHAAQAACGHSLRGLLGVQTVDGGWTDVAQALESARPVETLELPWRHAGGQTRWARLNARPMPSADMAKRGMAVSLQDISDERHVTERLEIAQEFGRLGVWERSIPSGEGQWDEHVFRFFGMDPSGGTPSHEAAAAVIHPDDRLSTDYSGSTQRAGRYDARFRLLLPDGRVRRLHSQWEVKNSPAGVPERAVGIMVDDTRTYELAQAFNDTSEQLRLAVELANIATWRQDLRTQRMYYNDRAYKVLDIAPRPEGMSMDEVRALIHPDDIPRVVAAAAAALESDRPVDMEARYRRADGSWRYVLTRRALRRDDAGKPLEFLGVALDVTEQVEESRRVSELAQRLDVASQTAGLGVFSRDPQTDEAEWNAEMFRLMGLPQKGGVPAFEDWVARRVQCEDREGLLRARDELLSGSENSHEQHYRVVMENGEVRWLMARARHVLRNRRRLVMGIVIDESERVRTDAALRSATERVALIARSVGLGTWEWEPLTGHTVWDEQMFRLRGRMPRAEPPDSFERDEMAHPEDSGRVKALLDDAVAHGRSAAYEFRVVWPDGSVHWLASRSTPLADADGRNTRYIGVNWDITESVNAEVARREKFIAQRESEAKSQFLARMSHELRTPLNAVLGFAQLLQLDVAGDAATRRGHVAHILSAGEHLLSLINEVLDLSSLESGLLKLDMQPVPLAELVDEALPLVSGLASRFGVAVRTGHLAGVAWGDRIRLRQVLINLLTNAIKYNRAGGEAHIDTRLEDGHWTLRVRDTGRGLTVEQQAHLFEPFNRLGIEREGIEGTGIGLAIVKTLVTRMGGSIHIDSQPGHGSLFQVSLRRADAAAAPRSARAPEHGTGGRVDAAQVLYIEDNPVNVMLLEELIASRPGFALASEPNGQRGVARARAMQPDIVLVDMQLPDFDGIEVLRRLRESPETAAIPCVALSANAMPNDVSRALAAGFTEYWTKPIDFAAFLRALEALLLKNPAKT